MINLADFINDNITDYIDKIMLWHGMYQTDLIGGVFFSITAAGMSRDEQFKDDQQIAIDIEEIFQYNEFELHYIDD